MGLALGKGSKSRKAASKSSHKALPQYVRALASSQVVSKLDELPRASGLLIGTHDGTFHCDEACAIALLKMLPDYERAAIVRTRDPSILEKCSIVVDVGAVYEPERHRYDHHQRGFDNTMAEIGHNTKLSSFGLIYRHFGMTFLRRLAGEIADHTPTPVDLDVIYRRVYMSFVEHIDGVDNGIEAFESDVRNYEVSTTLSSRVGALNPAWNEPLMPEQINSCFVAAVEMVGGELVSHIQACMKSWWPARTLVKAALERAAAIHPSRQILVLDHHCPWPSHLFQLEQEMVAAGDDVAAGVAKYVLFKDTKGENWRIQSVPMTERSFTSRQALPEPWRGLRDDSLSELTGIKDCIFVHAAGFMAGNKTKEGALAMATKAISDLTLSI